MRNIKLQGKLESLKIGKIETVFGFVEQKKWISIAAHNNITKKMVWIDQDTKKINKLN